MGLEGYLMDYEKEYMYYVNLFKNGYLKKFGIPGELKELADILKYKIMKDKLKGVDVDDKCEKLLKKLSELVIDLNKV